MFTHSANGLFPCMIRTWSVSVSEAKCNTETYATESSSILSFKAIPRDDLWLRGKPASTMKTWWGQTEGDSYWPVVGNVHITFKLDYYTCMLLVFFFTETFNVWVICIFFSRHQMHNNIFVWIPFYSYFWFFTSVVLLIRLDLHILLIPGLDSAPEDGSTSSKENSYQMTQIGRNVRTVHMCSCLDVGRQVTTTEGGILSVLLADADKGMPFTSRVAVLYKRDCWVEGLIS